MKRKSIDQIKTPAKIQKNEKEKNGVSVREGVTPKKTPAKIKKNGKDKNDVTVREEATPKKTPAKIMKNEKDENGVSVREEATPKKTSRKNLVVEQKSDKDLFSLDDLPDDVDVVENIDDEDFLGSSSEDESVEEKETKDDDEDEEEEDDDDDDEDDDDNDDNESDGVDSDEVDEKLIANDSTDDEGETDKDEAKTKRDFGLSSVLISSPSYVKKTKLEKSISKLEVNITRCFRVYSNTYLISCQTLAQAQLLLAPDTGLQISGSPLRVSKLPLYAILENLPKYIKGDDVKKAVSSCIDRSTIKNIVFLHINKCFVEFTAEEAFEKFMKKVSKLNVSGKTVKIVPWLDKLIHERTLRCIKLTHLPPKVTVEILIRKLLEKGINSKEIYDLKFFARNVCSLYFESEETEKKLLALDSKIQFEKGAVFMSLCTSKVVLSGLPESVSEKMISKALKNHEINKSNIHSIKVQDGTASIELKTLEEEQKVLELDSLLEIEGSNIKIVPLSVLRQNAVSLGLLKLPSSVTKTTVLEALAEEGHNFDEKDVEFEYGPKNSVLLFLDGSEDLQRKLSTLKKLNIGKLPVKVSFCKFGTGKNTNCSRKPADQKKRVQKKKKKNKNRQNKKQKKNADESD